MAITDNVLATLAEIPCDGGGVYSVKVVRGENGKPSVLLSFTRPGATPRFLILRGFAVRPLVDALLAFIVREKPLEPKYAAIRERLAAPVIPEVEAREPEAIPESVRRALPWVKRT